MKNEGELTLTRETKRCFLAIRFPIHAQREVHRRALSTISGRHFAVVDKENLHFTLCFLGELSWKEIEDVKEKVQLETFPAFPIQLGGVGNFKERVLFAKPQKGQHEISLLASSIKHQLSYRPDLNFVAHATLARNKKAKPFVFHQTKQELDRSKIKTSFWCHQVDLLESDQSWNQTKYRLLHSFNLRATETAFNWASNAPTLPLTEPLTVLTHHAPGAY